MDNPPTLVSFVLQFISEDPNLAHLQDLPAPSLHSVLALQNCVFCCPEDFDQLWKEHRQVVIKADVGPFLFNVQPTDVLPKGTLGLGLSVWKALNVPGPTATVCIPPISFFPPPGAKWVRYRTNSPCRIDPQFLQKAFLGQILNKGQEFSTPADEDGDLLTITIEDVAPLGPIPVKGHSSCGLVTHDTEFGQETTFFRVVKVPTNQHALQNCLFCNPQDFKSEYVKLPCSFQELAYRVVRDETIPVGELAMSAITRRYLNLALMDTISLAYYPEAIFQTIKSIRFRIQYISQRHVSHDHNIITKDFISLLRNNSKGVVINHNQDLILDFRGRIYSCVILAWECSSILDLEKEYFFFIDEKTDISINLSELVKPARNLCCCFHEDHKHFLKLWKTVREDPCCRCHVIPQTWKWHCTICGYDLCCECMGDVDIFPPLASTFTKIPTSWEIGVREITNLCLDVSLQLTWDQLDEIYSLTHLQHLKFLNYFFISLSTKIIQLGNLEFLEIPKSCLTKICREIGKLNTLKYIDVSNTPTLIYLPFEVTRCPLRFVNIHEPQFEEVVALVAHEQVPFPSPRFPLHRLLFSGCVLPTVPPLSLLCRQKSFLRHRSGSFHQKSAFFFYAVANGSCSLVVKFPSCLILLLIIIFSINPMQILD